jgi:uncharacterized repeat protein (TIGR03803 family)
MLPRQSLLALLSLSLIVFVSMTSLPAAAASTYHILYSFDGTDGSQPSGNLVFDASGNLYGTAVTGGPHGGVVFELTPANGSWTQKVLHNFGGGDGTGPNGSLIFDASGNLYGTACCAGTNNEGVVFQLAPSGGKWTEKLLHTFKWGDGALPQSGLLLDQSGNLYGTTASGGDLAGYGVVFEVSPANDKWTQKVLHVFNNGNGSAPYAGLVADASGNLYGTTTQGGVSQQNSGGVVYELTPASGKWTSTVLYSFPSGEGTPYAPLILDSNGNLYGTISSGGAHGFGAVFELTPGANGAWSESLAFSFNGSSDGSAPLAGLVADAAGNLYGTTSAAGTHSGGTVFKLTPSGQAWTATILHSFGGTEDGSRPAGGLILDGSGNLYGTTSAGGSHGDGIVFEIIP